jgi:hypothetical protein
VEGPAPRKARPDARWALSRFAKVEGIEVAWPREDLIVHKLGSLRDTSLWIIEDAAKDRLAEIEVLNAPDEPDVHGAVVRCVGCPEDLPTAIETALRLYGYGRPMRSGREAKFVHQVMRSPSQARAWRLCRLEYAALYRASGGIPSGPAKRHHMARWPREVIGRGPTGMGAQVG